LKRILNKFHEIASIVNDKLIACFGNISPWKKKLTSSFPFSVSNAKPIFAL